MIRIHDAVHRARLHIGEELIVRAEQENGNTETSGVDAADERRVFAGDDRGGYVGEIRLVRRNRLAGSGEVPGSGGGAGDLESHEKSPFCCCAQRETEKSGLLLLSVL